MFGTGLLAVIACFVLTLVALNKVSRLETRIAQLKLQLGSLAGELAALRRQPGAPSAPPPEDIPAAAAPAAEPPAPDPAPELAETVVLASQPPAPKRDVEQALASRWFVWIGGLAIAIGGLLFIKYAYDNGLISPALQIVLGLLAGLGLVAAGEILRRTAIDPELRDSSFVPAALSAAGIAIVFASIYAGYALYAIVSPGMAFAGLAVTGIGALVLSRWQGPLIAALGLLGSFATPALIPSEHPSAWGFFAYLLVIVATSLAMLRGRNWWWLGFAALGGGTAWALLWIRGGLFAAPDTMPVGIFAVVLGAAAVFGLRGRSILSDETGSLSEPRSVVPTLQVALAGLAAALIVLAVLVAETRHAPLALAFMVLMVAGIVALAWAKAGLELLGPVAAITMLAVLTAWPEAAFHELALDDRGFWVSIPGGDAQPYLSWMIASGVGFMAIGIAGYRGKRRPVSWAALAAAAAVVFVFMAWARVDVLLAGRTWAVLGALAGAVLLGAAYVSRNRFDDAMHNLAGGILYSGSAILLVFALDRLFDGLWLSLAIAVLAAAAARLARIVPAWLAGPVTAALAALVTVRLFVSKELWFDDRTLPLAAHWPLYGYGVPALLFFLSSRWLKEAGRDRSAAALEGASLGLAMSLVSLELRVLIAGGVGSDAPGLLEMAAHSLTWLAAALGLMHRQRLFTSLISLWGARALLTIALGAIIFLSLVGFNPLQTGSPVPGVFFNALLLAYLAPVPLLGLVANRLPAIGLARARPAIGVLALLLVMVYLTLETKRLFQGPFLVPWSESVAEAYAYSAVWLALAVALFAAGIRLGLQYVRYAGLAVMVLVVLKVFVSDMSGLEGLYRIASFVGLGLCLVGIGWLYQRFVQKPAAG